MDKNDKQAGSKQNPIVIKKYANRRLYNTTTSAYITLDTLHKMVREGLEFVVCDARTGDDITRSVLTQIILEEEGKSGQTLLPESFLRQLIGFYGDQFNHMALPNYLETAMKSFQDNQNKMRELAKTSMGGIFPFPAMEEISKKNMDFMRDAMQLFQTAMPQATGQSQDDAPTTSGGKSAKDKADMDALKDQLASLQKQIQDMDK